ncbi:MAG TPA: hypothetical protein VFX16_02350 [Pseudonocardiaceae bacterium]|nr:hypothetical protein [Pseudonocardiaceae bacterium]
MSTLVEVITTIRAVLVLSAGVRRTLVYAGETLDRATEHFAKTLAGTRSKQAKQVIALLVEGRRSVDNANQLLGRAETSLRSYLHDIGSSSDVGSQEPPPTPAARTPPVTNVEHLRSELPPPVTRGTGQKTHGRWIAPDGSVRSVVSGGTSRPNE